jgi:site-specific DNA recombinase
MKNPSNDVQRVALYIRVSTEEQAQHGYSLEAQESALVEFANAHNYKIVNIYRDEGFSARKSVVKRKVMQQLLQDVQQNKIDLILFTKLDRWFRNVRDYHTVQAILDRYHVSWQAILEDYSTTTADGRLKVNIMLSVAENEADRTSERIRFVFDNKIKSGDFCFARPPYGYKVEVIDGMRKLVKDPDTEQIVSTFWEKCLKYRSVLRSIRETNIEFHLARPQKAWTRLFKNPVYAGIFHGIKDYCPAYISFSDWQELQRPEKRIKATQNNRVYLFAGLLRCPICGCTLKSTYSHCSTNKSIEYRHYRCNEKAQGRCTYNRAINEKTLEKYLIDNIRDEMEKFAVEYQAELSEKKKRYPKTDISKLKEQLRRLNTIYMSGNISDNDYLSQAQVIKAAIQKSESEQQELASAADLDSLRHFLQHDFDKIYIDMTDDEKQRLWRSLISEIHFKDNRVSEIIFNV